MRQLERAGGFFNSVNTSKISLLVSFGQEVSSSQLQLAIITVTSNHSHFALSMDIYKNLILHCSFKSMKIFKDFSREKPLKAYQVLYMAKKCYV